MIDSKSLTERVGKTILLKRIRGPVLEGRDHRTNLKRLKRRCYGEDFFNEAASSYRIMIQEHIECPLTRVHLLLKSTNELPLTAPVCRYSHTLPRRQEA